VQAGVKWGFDGLDEYVRFRRREVTVVGGMPSLGKTWIMLDAAYRLASAGVPVFIFSAETGRDALRMRLLARAAEVDSRALRGERPGYPLTRDEGRRLEQAAATLETLPIYTDFQALSADDVLVQVEECLLRERIPLDTDYVIWFDFLQFGSTMTSEEQTEYTRLSRLSSDFKLVAKTLDRAICVFSQLKREKEGNETPEINWFKGTGRIETDMDVGLIITGERMAGRSAPRTLTIVKQREGIANVRLDFTLQQAFGRWDYVGTGHAPTPEDGPLFADQPDPLEEA
jgi:replicative DNA helicase